MVTEQNNQQDGDEDEEEDGENLDPSQASKFVGTAEEIEFDEEEEGEEEEEE